MNKKKQIIGFTLLMCLSAMFVLCCLYLPLFYMKLCDYSTGDVLIEGNLNLLQFLKLGGDGDVWYACYDATGPMWLTLATICFNILTMIGCVFVFVLSFIGLIFVIKNRVFSFKNSAIYKTAGFVGGFAILSFVFQIVGFIVLTSLANNLIIFRALFGCYINLAIGIVILVVSFFVKNKEGKLSDNKVRDGMFFLLTALCSVGLGVMLVCCVQFDSNLSSLIYLGENNLTFLNLSKIAVNEIFGFANNPVSGDVPLGICFYGMLLVLAGLVFVTVCSIIGLIRAFKGKSTDWLSIRVKRWTRAILDVFSILFMLLVCSSMVLFSNIFFEIPPLTYSCFTAWVYVECVLPFVLVILTRFIGVYKEDKDNKADTYKNQETVVAQ